MCDLCMRVDGGHFRGCPYEPDETDLERLMAEKADRDYDRWRDLNDEKK